MLASATVREQAHVITAVPRVLVVDDEEPVKVTIQGVLELDGYAVTATASGEHAIELIRAQTFDLLLTDLRLDGFDGLQLVRELKQSSPDALAIMLTGYASLDSALVALREGAYDYLIKPCDVLELRATVSRGLEHARLAAQVRQRLKELELANETIRALNLELEGRVEQATAELREQISARDEFMATVSHDLKSPLTFIKGLSNLRRRRGVVTPETAPLLEALEQIEASAGRMAAQLDGLVDEGRLEAGRPLELRRDPIDIVGLARQVITEHQQTSDRHQIDLASSEPEIVGTWDGMRLGRVLDNLLSNAIKYSPRGGTVEVRILCQREPAPGWAVLSVQDPGEGIPEIDLPHIFEHFRRGKNVVGRFPGTGLGLSGVRQIVEQHGGTLGVESRVGHGTIFTIRLPVEAELG